MWDIGMTDHGLGGKRALAGFFYQMLATAAYSVKLMPRAPGSGDLDEVEVLIRAGRRTAPEPLWGEDLAVYLDANEFALIQFKSGHKIDLPTFRKVVLGFVKTYTRLGKAEKARLKALVLVTPGTLTDRLVATCFRAAEGLRDLLESDGAGSCWAAHVGKTIGSKSKVSDGTYQQLAEALKQEARKTRGGSRITVADLKQVLPLLYVASGQTVAAYVSLLETEARKRGLLDEELDGAMHQVVGLVFTSSVEHWRDINREILLSALTGQRHHPAGYAHPSAVHDGLKRRWEEWAPRKDPAYAQLVDTRQVEAVVGRMSGRLPDGWLAISGEGGVGKTGVLLLSCKKRCEPAEAGGTWYLPVHVDLPAGEGRDELLRRLSIACGRGDAVDETVLARMGSAAESQMEDYRILVVSDGADEHGALDSAGFRHLVALARGQSSRLSFVFSARSRTLYDRLSSTLCPVSAWDLEHQRTQLAESVVEVGQLGDDELFDLLQHLGLPEVLDAIDEWRKTHGAQWRDSFRVPARMFFFALLRRLKRDEPSLYTDAVGSLLDDGGQLTQGMRHLADMATREFCGRCAQLSGKGAEHAMDTLRELAKESEFEVEGSLDHLEFCRQAAECGLLDELRSREFRWTSEFIRAYLRSL